MSTQNSENVKTKVGEYQVSPYNWQEWNSENSSDLAEVTQLFNHSLFFFPFNISDGNGERTVSWIACYKLENVSESS